MSERTYSAGLVTAYGAAVRGGYRGTYAEFCRQQAEYADNAAAVEQAKTEVQSAATSAAGSATSAGASATAAAGSATSAGASATAAAGSATTAGQHKDAAATSATNAASSATAAAASATSAATSASAAQAVLESIPEDYSDLSEDVDRLKADLDAVDDSVAAALSATLAEAPVNLTSRYRYCISIANRNIAYGGTAYSTTEGIPVNAGDVLRISCSGNAGYAAYAFGTSDSDLLEIYPTENSNSIYAVQNKRVVVPAGATYLYLSRYTASDVERSATKMESRIDGVEATIQSQATITSDLITTLNGKIESLAYWENVKPEWIDRKAIDIDTMTIVGTSGIVEKVSEAIYVEPGWIIKLGASAYQGGCAEYALCDSSGNIISVYPNSETTGAHGGIYEFKIPTNVYYIYVSKYDSGAYALQAGVSIFRNNAEKKLYSLIEIDADDYEQGSISATTGEGQTRSDRYRSKGYIPQDIRKIEASNNHTFMLFAYDVEDNFIGNVYGGGVGSRSNAIQLNYINMDIMEDVGYKYKIAIPVLSGESKSDVLNAIKFYITLDDKITRVTSTLANGLSNEIESELYYKSSDDVPMAANSAAVFALYDELVTAYPNYVTKNVLTVDGFENYEYVFDSHAYNYQSTSRNKFSQISKPKILITTGVHGYEKEAVMSAYCFFKALCENRRSVAKLRQCFVIKIIPMVTSYGFDHNTRWNANGVNINRNFDADWVASGNAYENDYSGSAAASEAETQFLQAWLDANTDAALYIDSHNSGYTREVSYLGINPSITGADSVLTSFRYGINQVIGHWIRDRGIIDDGNTIFTYTGNMGIKATAERYGNTIGITSMTMECSNNQNGTGRRSNYTIGVGAETLAAFLLGLMKYHFGI